VVAAGNTASRDTAVVSFAIVARHKLRQAPTASAQRPHPAGDGPSDLIGRIFLEEMDSRDRRLGLRWPAADEVEGQPRYV
jgi:hypothetical protein